jgi:Family of unknown function (DUF6314)
MRIADTFGFLLGTWDLSRSYTDHLSGTDGTFEGRAVLAVTQSGSAAGLDRARYDEAGQMRLGAYRNAARRSLEYARRADGSVMLYRAGGAPYVDLDLTSGAWQASHPCGADVYETFTVARSPDIVQEYWRVRGATKDYTAVTTLRRVTG